ncbi:unnamed protein product [Schistosoma spindalis]|nr:unnamed protein product [Schistosoma spindale]
MTELASSYAQSNNYVRKTDHTSKKKKQVPPPKYLCVPGSLALLDRISIIDKSNSLCSEIKCLFQNNDIDIDVKKLKALQSGPDPGGIQLESESKAKSLKIGRSRRLLKKDLKHEWLKVADCRVFWSHIFLGSNEIIRCLESSVCNKSENSQETQGKRISCVFVDSGWLTSHYGHHLANLCTLLDIRLLAIKPTGSLPELVTTKFKPVKKLAVLGFCLSNEIPSDLSDICKQIHIKFPTLGDNTSSISYPMDIKKRETSYKTTINCSKASSLVEKKESWEDVEINSKLYDYSSPPHKFPITEFQSYLSSLALQSLESEIVHGMLDSDDQSNFEYSYDFCAYKSPVLKRVVARTERKTRKRKTFASQSVETSSFASSVNFQPKTPIEKKTNNDTSDKVKQEEVIPVVR